MDDYTAAFLAGLAGRPFPGTTTPTRQPEQPVDILGVVGQLDSALLRLSVAEDWEDFDALVQLARDTLLIACETAERQRRER